MFIRIIRSQPTFLKKVWGNCLLVIWISHWNSVMINFTSNRNERRLICVCTSQTNQSLLPRDTAYTSKLLIDASPPPFLSTSDCANCANTLHAAHKPQPRKTLRRKPFYFFFHKRTHEIKNVCHRCRDRANKVPISDTPKNTKHKSPCFVIWLGSECSSLVRSYTFTIGDCLGGRAIYFHARIMCGVRA